MQRRTSISNFNPETFQAPSLEERRSISPIIHQTSTIAASALKSTDLSSPVRNDSKDSKCPDSADSTGSLNNAFTCGINMDSPLTEKHLGCSASTTAKLGLVFDEKISSGPMEISHNVLPSSKKGILPITNYLAPQEKVYKRSRANAMVEDDLSNENLSFLATLSKKSRSEPEEKL